MSEKLMNLAEIKPYWRNPRKNNGAIEAIKESIIKFGYRSRIMVDSENTIIVGHSRYKALTELKGKLEPYIKELTNKINDCIKKDEKEAKTLADFQNNLESVHKGRVPVIIAEGLSDAQAKEYRLSDNKTGELSEWDFEKLRFELRELNEAVGFTAGEIGNILQESDLKKDLVTDEDIKKAEKAEAEKVTQTVEKHERNQIKLVCPHCGGKMGVNRDELLNQ